MPFLAHGVGLVRTGTTAQREGCNPFQRCKKATDGPHTKGNGLENSLSEKSQSKILRISGNLCEDL